MATERSLSSCATVGYLLDLCVGLFPGRWRSTLRIPPPPLPFAGGGDVDVNGEGEPHDEGEDPFYAVQSIQSREKKSFLSCFGGPKCPPALDAAPAVVRRGEAFPGSGFGEQPHEAPRRIRSALGNRRLARQLKRPARPVTREKKTKKKMRDMTRFARSPRTFAPCGAFKNF